MTDSTIEHDLQTQLRKKRIDILYDKKVEDIASILSQIRITSANLTLEVEELKEAKDSISADLQKILQNSTTQMSDDLSKTLINTLQKHMESTISPHAEIVSKIRQESEESFSNLRSISKHTRFTAILISTISALACFLMASGLFCFFPNNTSITYNMTQDQARDLFIGRAVRENFGQLSDATQGTIVNSVTRAAQKMKKRS